MGKYLAPKYQRKKKRSFGWFLLGMLIYAVVFLTAVGFGLKFFWKFMAGYEASRPQNTVDAYMEQLTEDHICDLSGDVIDRIDHGLQSVEECRTYIKESINGGVTCAKKSKECTDTRQVYVLRTGSTVIGQFAITAGSPDEYGFTVWSVTEESFDLSYLIGDTVSMTVPDSCTVWVNGHQLGSEYVTVDDIHYEELEDYYSEYDLPHRMTYEAGPFLGQMEISAKDAEGNPVSFDDNTDYSVYYHNCTQQEQEELDPFVEEVVERYVAFTGSTKNTRNGNYSKLMEYVLPNSDLANRLKLALDGLQYGQSLKDEVVSLTTHHQIRLEEGRYLCDITYEVDTTGKKGVVRTATNAKMIVVDTDSSLKLESINLY